MQQQIAYRVHSRACTSPFFPRIIFLHGGHGPQPGTSSETIPMQEEGGRRGPSYWKHNHVISSPTNTHGTHVGPGNNAENWWFRLYPAPPSSNQKNERTRTSIISQPELFWVLVNQLHRANYRNWFCFTESEIGDRFYGWSGVYFRIVHFWKHFTEHGGFGASAMRTSVWFSPAGGCVLSETNTSDCWASKAWCF